MSPYYSIKEAFRSHAGCLGALLVHKTFDNAHLITKVNAPILIIHGQADTLIPIDHSKRL